MERLLLPANILATLYMVGVIWMVQLVHYPLFRWVGSENYREYQKRHQWLMMWVVGPPMLIEAITAALLLRWPGALPLSEIGLGFVLVLVIWLSTAAIQVPCHERLAQGFDEQVHRRLVSSNWIRTIAWSGRAALIAYWLLSGPEWTV